MIIEAQENREEKRKMSEGGLTGWLVCGVCEYLVGRLVCEQ